MTENPTKRDLQKVIEDVLRQPYAEVEEDDQYQQEFSGEGDRKAQYIFDDLRRRESMGNLRLADLAYLSIGGADGSEVEWMLRETAIPKGVIIEKSESGAQRARLRAQKLIEFDKELVVIKGDAMTDLGEALEQLEKWLTAGEISGLVCSAQAVLHELPRRSPTFDLSIFLGKLFRDERWNVRAFYSREPGRPEGWTENVQIRIPGVRGDSLAKFAMYTRDRLSMKGNPEALTAGWVGMPSLLAVETLHKLIRGGSVKRIGYELGEQLTEFEPFDVKRQLEALILGMHVSVDRITTPGFKEALELYAVRYMGHKAESLPIPRTHAEIVGFISAHPPSLSTKQREAENGLVPPPLSSEEIDGLFGRDVKKEEVDAWLTQFDVEERVYVGALLRGFKYYGKRHIASLCRELYRLVMQRLGTDNPRHVRFVQFGGAAKSGALVAFQFRIANNLSSDFFLEAAALRENEELDGVSLVFLDDILASGHQAAEMWRSLTDDGRLKTTTRAILATLIGTPAGARHVEERTTFETCAAVVLDEADDPFGAQSQVFANDQAREITLAIVESYGRRLLPMAPLGFLGRGMLVGFNHGTPDNTLPIFWSTRCGWRPLLDAGGSNRLSVPAAESDVDSAR